MALIPTHTRRHTLCLYGIADCVICCRVFHISWLTPKSYLSDPFWLNKTYLPTFFWWCYCFCMIFFYRYIPRPLLLWDSQFFSIVGLQTGTPFVCAEIKFCLQGSKMLLWTLPSFISLFPDHSFYEKVYFCQKWSCRQELPQSVRNSNFALNALKCFSRHFFLLSIYSQTSPSMRK